MFKWTAPRFGARECAACELQPDDPDAPVVRIDGFNAFGAVEVLRPGQLDD